MKIHPTIEARIQEMYSMIPEKEDLVDAANWARDTLRDREGRGHHFEISVNKDGLLMCSFAKPEWAGDHCGRPMGTAAEAIVMAVCEYLNGA